MRPEPGCRSSICGQFRSFRPPKRQLTIFGKDSVELLSHFEVFTKTTITPSSSRLRGVVLRRTDTSQILTPGRRRLPAASDHGIR